MKKRFQKENRNCKLRLKFFLWIFFSVSINAELNTKSEYFQTKLKDVLELETCRLSGNERSRDVSFVEDMRAKVGMSEDVVEGVVTSILRRTSSSNLNCYLKINLTALLAQSMDRLGHYYEAVDLYEKLLTYRNLDSAFKNNINRLISRAKSKQIERQRSSDNSLSEIKVEVSATNEAAPEIDSASELIITTLKEQISEQQSEISRLKSQASSASNEMNALKITLDKALDDLERERLYVQKLERELLEYEISDPDFENTDKVVQELYDQLTFYEDQNSFLANSNKELEEQIEKLEKDIFGVNKQIEVVERQLERLTTNNSAQGGFQGITLLYLFIAFIIGAIISRFYNQETAVNQSQQAGEDHEAEEPKEISDISDFEDLEVALDSLLLLEDFGFNDKGNFLFGYIAGLIEASTDDPITASLERDKLLERYFDLKLVEIEKYFRFNSSIDVYESALEAGTKDAASFEEDDELPMLEDYLKILN